MEKIELKLKLKRILKAGFFNFWRNGYVSIASVLVMLFTLFTIGGVMFMGAVLNVSLEELKEKVDINVYFITSASEQDIFYIKTRLEAMPEVLNVSYTSKEQALIDFKERHKNDEITLQALEELGENPLGASLNIKAKEPSQYEGVANFLSEDSALSSTGQKIIDKVNYFENKIAIEKLSKIISAIKNLGLAVSLVLVLVSIIITFNTIRLVIYMSKEEISVMQLVGASKNYVRGPFVITGVIVGLLAGLVTVLSFLPLSYYIGKTTENFFVGLNIFDYYLSNFLEIIFIVLFSGIFIGAVSSFLAVRKYLKL